MARHVEFWQEEILVRWYFHISVLSDSDRKYFLVPSESRRAPEGAGHGGGVPPPPGKRDALPSVVQCEARMASIPDTRIIRGM